MRGMSPSVPIPLRRSWYSGDSSDLPGFWEMLPWSGWDGMSWGLNIFSRSATELEVLFNPHSVSLSLCCCFEDGWLQGLKEWLQAHSS